jgi:hypothetical protein
VAQNGWKVFRVEWPVLMGEADAAVELWVTGQLPIPCETISIRGPKGSETRPPVLFVVRQTTRASAVCRFCSGGQKSTRVTGYSVAAEGQRFRGGTLAPELRLPALRCVQWDDRNNVAATAATDPAVKAELQALSRDLGRWAGPTATRPAPPVKQAAQIVAAALAVTASGIGPTSPLTTALSWTPSNPSSK